VKATNKNSYPQSFLPAGTSQVGTSVSAGLNFNSLVLGCRI